jgi:hypothetical protein
VTGFQALKTPDGSGGKTRVPLLQTCTSKSYDEKFHLSTCFLVFHSPFSAFSQS